MKKTMARIIMMMRTLGLTLLFKLKFRDGTLGGEGGLDWESEYNGGGCCEGGTKASPLASRKLKLLLLPIL